MKVIKEYEFNVRPGKIILAALFFAVCAAFFFREAITNYRGLIINGIIKLNVEQGTVFYYVLAGLSCLFVLGGIYGLASGIKDRRKLVIYSDGLGIPAQKETVRLYFRDIASAQVVDIYKTRSIEIKTAGGKTYSIPDVRLGSKAEFDEVSVFISGGMEKGQL